ncbi:DNA adenine methylase [Burkholderia thailandensis]|uniref:DNA adenine methylase n=1 Tax=Burkholderia thailandensis TaxID=57975 RepID=UPI0022ABE4CD|nr:DNA adenine methylase [Burkholderia thailandensis]MCZ2901189.1 DNA adenine methylase [Burkholderia thailandensis]MDD1481259.1 DNA adenine methylase [Burkholderia thailandensis]MDD1487924.1 DNA adenine methylase [Burkholderia thailandensis]MDD1494218.1 DNA adenine methylase [Burkholderia thailandensis]
MKTASPLRYPGGKWRVAPFFGRLLAANGLEGIDYAEPYAGGASLALSLLFQDKVGAIHLNDLDIAIYSFWWAVLKDNQRFIDRIATVEVTPDEWMRQRNIYLLGARADRFALGFATFFLNRTNHSGIMNGGMIGGKAQNGTWKLDARFNKVDLADRVARVGRYQRRIRLSNLDALAFLSRLKRQRGEKLIYLDPPYFKKGPDLYLNAYGSDDHAKVREAVDGIEAPWIVSYDDVPEIRKLYTGVKARGFDLLHNARTTRTGREVLFFSNALRVPRLVA